MSNATTLLIDPVSMTMMFLTMMQTTTNIFRWPSHLYKRVCPSNHLLSVRKAFSQMHSRSIDRAECSALFGNNRLTDGWTSGQTNSEMHQIKEISLKNFSCSLHRFCPFSESGYLVAGDGLQRYFSQQSHPNDFRLDCVQSQNVGKSKRKTFTRKQKIMSGGQLIAEDKTRDERQKYWECLGI